MKELNAFELFGRISDQYVSEAVISTARVLPMKRKTLGETAFGRFINSPWGVAILCAVVSLGVLVGIIAAGNRDNPVIPPVINTEESEGISHPETDAEMTEGSTEPIEEIKHPAIEKKQYGEEVVVLYNEQIFEKDRLYADAGGRAGDILTESLYTRVMQTEDYLGIDLVFQGCADESGMDTEMWKLKNSGDYMAHLLLNTGEGLAEQHNVLTDLSSLAMIDTDADYWDSEMMTDHAIGGGIYFGTNAFIPPNAYLLAYNKALYQASGSNQNLYDLVDGDGWTLDAMLAVCAEAEECEFVFTSRGESPLRAFQTGSEIYVLDATDHPDGLIQKYVYDVHFDKALDLFAKMKDFFVSNRVAPMYYPAEYEAIGNGNVLFEPMLSREVSARREGQDIGVLPFPKYDTAQTDYVSLYMSGYLGIFADDGNVQMCGEAAELLAYCSKDMSEAYSRAYLGIGSGQITPSEQRDLDMMDIIHDARTDLGMVASDLTELSHFMPLKWVRGEPSLGIGFGSRFEVMVIRELAKWGYE